jgi:hypothetical protein
MGVVRKVWGEPLFGGCNYLLRGRRIFWESYKVKLN